jgi:uncharacterized protein YjbI with pentapeptide repeats
VDAGVVSGCAGRDVACRGGATLRGADLTEEQLGGANVTNAILTGAIGVDLSNSFGTPAQQP